MIAWFSNLVCWTDAIELKFVRLSDKWSYLLAFLFSTLGTHTAYVQPLLQKQNQSEINFHSCLLWSSWIIVTTVLIILGFVYLQRHFQNQISNRTDLATQMPPFWHYLTAYCFLFNRRVFRCCAGMIFQTDWWAPLNVKKWQKYPETISLLCSL